MSCGSRSCLPPCFWSSPCSASLSRWRVDLRFSGRRVAVVGGSYGIGLAAARQMAAEGGELAIVSRRPANLAEAADAIAAAAGRPPATIAADVTEAGAGETIAAELAGHWGSLDALVTAVGGSIRSAFADLSDEQWLQNYSFNVLS